MADSNEGRVFGLDFLRAVAIACVVLAHGGLAATLGAATQAVPGLGSATPWLGLLGHGGMAGVELFFVLSGFLIGGILLRGARRFNEPRGLLLFYSRRWFRTLPLFWLFVLFNTLFERFFHHRSLGISDVFEHALFLRNFSHVSLSFFPESWSLAVEEWFYLLFPAALWLGSRLAPDQFVRVFIVCAALFFVFAVTARTWGAMQPGATWVNTQRCTVIYRFDALMSGAIAAWIAHVSPAAWRRGAGWCALAGGIVVLVTYTSLWTFGHGGLRDAADTFFAKTFRFNFLSLGFALLLPLASRWTPVQETLIHAAVRKIALWSYALYLVHWPLFQIFASPAFQKWPESWMSLLLLFSAKITIAILLSLALYRQYEAPCTRLREKIPAWLTTPARPPAT